MSKADPIEIVIKATGDVVGYICGTCKCPSLAMSDMTGERSAESVQRAYQDARHCCNPSCEKCGAPAPRYRYLCNACDAERQRAERAMDFAEAEKVPAKDYKGWVSWDDEYFPSVDEFREDCERRGRDVPPFVWACKSRRFEWNIDEALDSALDEHHEDARDWLVDVDELRAFVAAWVAKQTLVTYYEDRTRAVVLDEQA